MLVTFARSVVKADIKIALIGNPNSGKTTLFNALTGLRQKVGNYPGVTVDRKSGYWKYNSTQTAEIIDLPGTYSIYPKRPDERIATETILNKKHSSHPDLLVVVCDVTSLQRNLLLCTQVIDLGLPVVVALTMMDVAQRDKLMVDATLLEQKLGVPVVDVTHCTKQKLKELSNAIQKQITHANKVVTHYLPEHSALSDIAQTFELRNTYTALVLLHQFEELKYLTPKQKEFLNRTLTQHQLKPPAIQADEILHRYRLIQDIIISCVKKQSTSLRSRSITKKIDDYLLHPFWGYMVFILVFFFIFQALFNWAEYPMEAINFFFARCSSFTLSILPPSIITNLLAEGILPGIGGVIAFIPQILILFGFIAILEETGYMSRISILTDRVFHKLGMNGKSSVSLIGGLACAVPAIMGTRTIESYKERLITILVTPLMSCSARLPVYVLLVGFVVPDKDLWGIVNLQGLVMFMLYLSGFFMALVVSFILKLFIKVRESGVLISELPIYRMPRWDNVVYTMFEKVKVFVWEAGKIIVLISVVLWFLASFGPGDDMERAEQAVRLTYTDGDSTEMQNHIQSAKLNASYAGVMGKWIEPVIAPLGFDWKIGIAIITSFAAREVFVGTMATIYSVGSTDDPDFNTIREKMKHDVHHLTGKPLYTPATGLALILFYVFAMQCMSTLAVVKRETKSWKWPLIQFGYMTLLAWLAARLAYLLLS